MRISQVCLLAFTALFFGSCKDEASKIGSEIFPGNEIIGTAQYTSNSEDIQSSVTQAEAFKFAVMDYVLGSGFTTSTFTKNSVLILGESIDPKFGKVKADFFSQLNNGSNTTNKLKLTDNYVLLSTKLHLYYSKNYWEGDTSAQHKISVYEVTEDLIQNTKSDIEPTGKYNPTSIGEKIITLKDGINDTIWDDSDYIHKISIDIDNSIGLRLFEADSATIVDQSAFNSFFKGIYVTSQITDDSNGSFLKLMTSDEEYQPRLVLEYKTSQEDTVSIIKEFPISEIDPVKINRFKYDYTNAEISFENTNAPNLYIQPKSGSCAKIKIADVFKLSWEDSLARTSPIYGIASAELNFYIDTTKTDHSNYPVPEQLEIYKLDDNGEYKHPTFTNKDDISQDAFTSGILSKNENNTPIKYTFRLAEGFLEELVKDNVDFSDLYLMPRIATESMSRVILHNTNIEADENDTSIKPSGLSIKYVKIQ
jgi:hypothetical protein